MQQLNLPVYSFKIQSSPSASLRAGGEKQQILDEIRKKYVALTPEEWVRQNFIRYLIYEKRFPAALIAIEAALQYNSMKKRGDVVVYDRSGKPVVIVECKAPDVNITQNTFDQIARYNMALKVKYLIVTNGLTHFCCSMDYKKKSYEFLEEIPLYKDISL